MPELSKFQAETLNGHLNPSDPDNMTPEQELYANNPELRAYAEEQLGLYVTKASKEGMQQNLRLFTQGPGAMADQFISGAVDASKGVLGLGFDLLAGMAPEGSDFERGMMDRSEEIRMARTAAEDALQVRRAETIGEQGPFIEAMTGQAPYMGGQALPFMYNPQAAVTTLPRMIAYNSVVGGLGATAVDRDAEQLADRVGEMSWGALLGGTSSAVVGALPAIRNSAARGMSKQLETDLAKATLALEKEVQRVTGNPEFAFSLGEITANPFVVGLERNTAGTITREAQNARLQTMVDALKMRTNALSQSGNADDIAIDMHKTLTDLNTQLQTRASQNFARGLDNVIEAADGKVIVDGRTYLSKVDDLISEYSDPNLGGNLAPAFLVKQREEIFRMVHPVRTVEEVNNKGVKSWVVRRWDDNRSIGRFNRADEAAQRMTQYNLENGGLDAETTTNLLRSFRRISSGEVPVWDAAAPGSNRNLSLALKKGLLDSFEDGAVDKESLDAIQSLRSIYAYEQAHITGINNKLLAGVFGVPDASAINAQTAWAQLRGRSIAAQRKTASILELYDPQLLDDMRALAIRDVVDASFVPGQRASLTPYSPIKLADNLAGGTGETAGAMRGLFEPDEVRDFRRFGDAMRRFNEVSGLRFETAAATEVRDASINLISRSPEFFGRWLTGVMLRSKNIERMIQDPAWRESFITWSKAGVSGQKRQAAVMYMTLTAAEWMASDEAAHRAEQRRQAEQDFAADPMSGGPAQ